MNKSKKSFDEKCENGRKKRACAIIALLLFASALLLFTALLFPFYREISIKENLEKVKEYVEAAGALGWFFALVVQILQIVIAFLPGEPVELALGVLFGPLYGTLMCLLGIFIGTLAVFFISRRYGVRIATQVFGEKRVSKYRAILSGSKRDAIVFALFLIPGTPKDALTYLVPLTDMRVGKYLLVATLARFPSVITSTVLGESLVFENKSFTLVVFLVTAALSLLGFVIGERIVGKGQEGD